MDKWFLLTAGLVALLLGGCFSSCGTTEAPASSFSVGSYIRPQFYSAGRVDGENMLACQDLILFAAEPKGHGELYFKFEVWEEVNRKIRQKLEHKNIHLRLGVHHGDWRSACCEEYRSRFVEAVARAIADYGFDGVDLDFEWPSTAEEYADYSATIVALKARLGEACLLSVSLHPTAYRISPEAIRAADWISLQCYGPRPLRFSFEMFESDVKEAIQYGIPANKLVAGLPFYATAGRGVEGTVAYRQLVEAGVVTDSMVNQVVWNGSRYMFNGQCTLRQKVKWARDMGLRGVMSWDLATDCAYSHPQSLQRAVVEAAIE